MEKMEIMENINYKQYLEKINKYNEDIEALKKEEKQLNNELEALEDVKATTIQERKEKSKKLIEKRLDLQVTSETLKSINDEFEQYCRDNLEDVNEVIYELQQYLTTSYQNRKKSINNEIKQFAEKIFNQIASEVNEQNILEDKVSEIHCELSKITKYGKESYSTAYGVQYEDMYTKDIFIDEMKRLTLE